MSNFFAEQGRTRGYNEAYFSYVEEVTPRRTQLSGNRAIFGWKLVSPCFSQSDAEQTFAKGVQYGAQGNFIKAREEFEKTLKADPLFETAERFLKLIKDVNHQKITAQTAIGLFKGIDYRFNGRLDDALGEYNKILETNPMFSLAFNSRGLIYKAKKQYDKAISDFTRAIELNPKLAVAYFNRGLAYRSKRQYDKAISDCTKAIEINSKFPEAYSGRGFLYARRGEYDQAISDFTRAIEFYPEHPKLYYYRGVFHGEKGKFDKAIPDLTKAIELDPNFAKAYDLRGQAYFEEGEFDLACADWRQACKLGVCLDYELVWKGSNCK